MDRILSPTLSEKALSGSVRISEGKSNQQPGSEKTL
jgi:hypothetical protein